MTRPAMEGDALVRTSSRLAGLIIVVALIAVVFAPSAFATKIISYKTIKNAHLAAGTHDVIYDHVTFIGGSSTRAVLTIDQAAYNITIRYSTIAAGGGWNGVSINDRLGNVHDITFLHDVFRTQRRMGIEVTSRPVSPTEGYRNINI